jgi:hypothetical protein
MSARIQQGTPVPPSDARRIDPLAINAATVDRPSPEVEGQCMQMVVAACPEGHVVWVPLSGNRDNDAGPKRCGVCGELFYLPK